MAANGEQNTTTNAPAGLAGIGSYLQQRWYLLLLALVVGGVLGYIRARSVKPTYTASMSFVLSTEQRPGGNFANLAAQLGFDAMTGSADNIFSGDNIIELFKSRKLVTAALQSEAVGHTTLLNLAGQRLFADKYAAAGALGKNPASFTPAQRKLYQAIVAAVKKSFIVFKRDKKLIVYIISATSTDPDVAYHSARLLLDQTSRYFIETKTKVSASSVKLLQHEADSLGRVLRETYVSTAATNDRTFNINPSVTVQRSGAFFNQAKAAAFAAAYAEVMRNLEIAKINLQKETPLYRIIDDPELPLIPTRVSALKYAVAGAVGALLVMAGCMAALKLYQQK